MFEEGIKMGEWVFSSLLFINVIKVWLFLLANDAGFTLYLHLAASVIFGWHVGYIYRKSKSS